jgi:hypothetical protein
MAGIFQLSRNPEFGYQCKQSLCMHLAASIRTLTNCCGIEPNGCAFLLENNESCAVSRKYEFLCSAIY